MTNRIQFKLVDFYVFCVICDGERYTFMFDRAHYKKMLCVVGQYGRSGELDMTEEDAKRIQSGIIDVMESIGEKGS